MLEVAWNWTTFFGVFFVRGMNSRVNAFACLSICCDLDARTCSSFEHDGVQTFRLVEEIIFQDKETDRHQHGSTTVLGIFPHIFLSAKWLVTKSNRSIRAFLLKGSEECNGGHCLVSWHRSADPSVMAVFPLKTLKILLSPSVVVGFGLRRWTWRSRG